MQRNTYEQMYMSNMQCSFSVRADKKAEAERLEREQQMQQERDDEMREMAIKIRRRYFIRIIKFYFYKFLHVCIGWNIFILFAV